MAASSPGRRWTAGGTTAPGVQADGLRVERVLASGASTDLLLARAGAAFGGGWRVLKQLRSGADRSARRAFEEELSRTVRCRGPHLPSGIAATAGSDQAISLPLFNGPDLATVEVELLRRSRGLPAAACAWVALALAQALQSLHDGTAVGEPLCHGALEPENVIATLDGDCVLIDLGRCAPATDANRAADVRALGYLVGGMLGDPSSDPRPLQRRLHTLARKLRDAPEAHPAPVVVADLARLLERRAELDPRGLLAAELRELFGQLARKGAIWAIPPGPLRPPSVPLALAWPRAGVSGTDRSVGRQEFGSFGAEAADSQERTAIPAAHLDPAPTLRPPPTDARSDQRRALLVALLVFGVGLIGLRWFFSPAPARVVEAPTSAVSEAPAPPPAREPPPAAAALVERPPAPAATPRSARPDPTPRPQPKARVEPPKPKPRAAAAPVEPAPAAAAEPEPAVVEATPAPPPKPPAEANVVKLVIVSEPPGASIAVDGKELGPAPAIARVKPGGFVEIRASMPGYLATHKLHKAAEKDGRFTVKLAPE